jgi:basic membrane protein A and related proteins
MRKAIKKSLSLFILCTMLFALTACGSQGNKEPDKESDNTNETTDNANEEDGEDGEDEGDDSTSGDEDPLKVVYLVNGSLGDKGFYDSAASGITQIQNDLGGEVKIVEMGRDETSYEGHYLDVSEQDWDVIVAGTWSVKEITEQTAAQFPEKNYILFDSDVDRSVASEGNIMGLTYNSNQGAFLAGVLAARMLESDDEKIDSSEKTLGFVGSMDVANINEFLVGYLEGVAHVDPDIKVLTSYVGSFEDVPKALEMSTQLYNQGAQIVYAPASQSILGAATAASNADKYLIACDQDLYTQLIDEQPEIAKNIITSTLKNVGASLFTAVEGVQSGTMNFEETYALGLDSGSVGLAENENFMNIVPQEIKEELYNIRQQIIDGEIEVSNALEMSTEEVAQLRDSMN